MLRLCPRIEYQFLRSIEQPANNEIPLLLLALARERLRCFRPLSLLLLRSNLFELPQVLVQTIETLFKKPPVVLRPRRHFL